MPNLQQLRANVIAASKKDRQRGPGAPSEELLAADKAYQAAVQEQQDKEINRALKNPEVAQFLLRNPEVDVSAAQGFTKRAARDTYVSDAARNYQAGMANLNSQAQISPGAVTANDISIQNNPWENGMQTGLTREQRAQNEIEDKARYAGSGNQLQDISNTFASSFNNPNQKTVSYLQKLYGATGNMLPAYYQNKLGTPQAPSAPTTSSGNNPAAVVGSANAPAPQGNFPTVPAQATQQKTSAAYTVNPAGGNFNGTLRKLGSKPASYMLPTYRR